jgi:uncharacterized protein YutE (UPF0331/DUF86 family)
MTPARLNPPTIVARLRLITEAIEDLEALGEVTAEGLQQDRHSRRVVERCLELLVDAAAAINAHVAAALTRDPPTDMTQSFAKAAAAGLLSEELAARLRPSAGMRNAIVHAYVDLDLQRVAAAVPLAIADYTAYVQAVATFLANRSATDQEDPAAPGPDG